MRVSRVTVQCTVTAGMQKERFKRHHRRKHRHRRHGLRPAAAAIFEAAPDGEAEGIHRPGHVEHLPGNGRSRLEGSSGRLMARRYPRLDPVSPGGLRAAFRAASGDGPNYHLGPGSSAEKARPASRPGMSPSSDSLSSSFSQPPRKPSGPATVTATNHTVFDYSPSPVSTAAHYRCTAVSPPSGPPVIRARPAPAVIRAAGAGAEAPDGARARRDSGIPQVGSRPVGASDAAGQVAGFQRSATREPECGTAARTAAARPEAESFAAPLTTANGLRISSASPSTCACVRSIRSAGERLVRFLEAKALRLDRTASLRAPVRSWLRDARTF